MYGSEAAKLFLNLALAYQTALAVLTAAKGEARAAAPALVEAMVACTGAAAGTLWRDQGAAGTDGAGRRPVARAGENAGGGEGSAPAARVTLPVAADGTLELVFRPGQAPDRALLDLLAPLVRLLGPVLVEGSPQDIRRAWPQEVIDNAIVGVYVIQDDRFRFVNARFADIFGYTVEELENRPFLDVVADEDKPLVASKVRSKITGEEPVTTYGFRGRRRDGGVVYVEVMSSRTTFLGRPAVQGTLVDLTGHWQKEQALREHLAQIDQMSRRLRQVNLRLVRAQRIATRLARTDPLTGLANRRAFARELHKACRHALRTGKPLTVLVLDLDNLKTVNDRFGHQKGDAVLVQAAELLRSELRQKDVVARIGGDEFAVLLPGVDASQSARIADRIRQRSREVLTAITGIPVGFSVGLAVACGDADPDRLLAAADSAMYEDKQKKH